MIHSTLIQLRELYRTHTNLFVIGFLFIAMYVLFSGLVMVYMPRSFSVMMRHAGIFFTDSQYISIVAVFLLILLALYIYFVRFAHRTIKSSQQFRIILIFSCIFIVLLLLTPPFFSSDLFGNGSRAIIATTHQANPYEVAPDDLGYSEYVAWGQYVAPYGPLFTGFTLLVSQVSGDSIMLFVLFYRLIAALAVMTIAFLLYKIIQKLNPTFAFAGVALFLWNPFVLFELVHSGHNDVFVILLLVLTVWLCVEKKFVWALLALVAGYLIKFVPAALIPIVGVLMLMESRSLIESIKKTLLVITGAAVMIGLAYWPFGGNIVANVGNAIGGFVQYNHLTFPQSIITAALMLADRLIDGITLSTMATRVAYVLVFLIFYVILLARPRLTEPDQYIQRMFWILVAFVFLLGAKLNIWYILWFTPFVLLVRNVWYHYVIVLITLLGFLYYSMFNVFFPTLFFFLLGAGYYVFWRWRKTDSLTTK